MKKIFTPLLVALAVALAACGDEKTKDQADWFLTPEAVVDGTTVEVSCLTRFGDGVLSAVGAGFIYQPVGEVAFGDLSPSKKFTPAVYTCRGGVWEGGSTSMFTPALKFTLCERCSSEGLEVSEPMEMK